MISLIISAFLCIYGLHSAACLARNICIATSFGVPVVWSPISPYNPFWLLFGKSIAPLIRLLPLRLGQWADINTIDWTWVDRAHRGSEAHRYYGETFALVTPRDIDIHTRDPVFSDQVLRTRSADFPKISHFAKPLDIFGPSLVSSDADTWNRHRKITVASLSDRTNRLVWWEAARQAQQMTDYYMAISDGIIIDAVEDTRKLYLHVLTSACFGIKYDYASSSVDSILEGHRQSYKDCLFTCLSDLTVLRLVPRLFLRLPVLPRRIAQYRDAWREMGRYLDEMVSSSKKEIHGSKEHIQRNNLLTIMVQKSEELRYEVKDVSSRDRLYLTDPEVYGNLFTFSLGGHESTAHTLTFAIYLLAIYPHVQDWLFEEFRTVLGQDEDVTSEDNLSKAFPKMTRSMAIMNETLRVYPSVTIIPKTTGPTSAAINLQGREQVLPANVNVYVNVPSIQVHTDLWGDDARSWKPSRWVDPSPKGLQGEQIKPAPRGAFVPWSEGKRVCPGKRFSQVAFTAALAALFSRYSFEIVPKERESQEHARERALAVVEDTYAVLTVHMFNPRSVTIKIVPRNR